MFDLILAHYTDKHGHTSGLEVASVSQCQIDSIHEWVGGIAHVTTKIFALDLALSVRLQFHNFLIIFT